MKTKLDKPLIGFAFATVGLAVCAVLFYALHYARIYGHAVREFLLWAIVPQFAMGMFSMAALMAVFVVVLVWSGAP